MEENVQIIHKMQIVIIIHILMINLLNDWVIFFKVWFYFLMLFTINVILFYKIDRTQYLFGQHCGYWCSGALAPGHQ